MRTKRPVGRPRVLPNRWRANVILHACGLGPHEISRLLDIEIRVAERNYKRDKERYLPEAYLAMSEECAKLVTKNDVQ